MRVEQKNNTLLEMGFYDDGPYEVGDESRLDPVLVPVPANSYLGGFELCLLNIACTCRIHVCRCLVPLMCVCSKSTNNIIGQYEFSEV